MPAISSITASGPYTFDPYTFEGSSAALPPSENDENEPTPTTDPAQKQMKVVLIGYFRVSCLYMYLGGRGVLKDLANLQDRGRVNNI